jgi:hypothetical protein
LRAPTRNLFFLRLVASDYGINEIADNFLPLVPSQISAMTLGGFFLAWLVSATNQFFVFLIVIAGSDPRSVFFAVGGIRLWDK